MARLKIADMEVGQVYKCPLAVISAISRTTRNGKPYLVPWTTETYEAKIIGGIPPHDTITCVRNLAQHVKSELTRKNEPRIRLIIDPEYKDDKG